VRASARGPWAIALGLGLTGVLGVGGAVAGVGGGAAPAHPAKLHHGRLNATHRGLSKARVRQIASHTSTHRVVVVLGNQHRATPANRAHASSRSRALAADQAPLAHAVSASGGSVYRHFHAFNAFAAKVSPAEISRLRADRRVAKVVPDQLVQLPTQSAAPAATGSAAAVPTPPPGACPSDPAKPISEPEALATTRSDQAASLATGKGVTVAFFADGLDPDNPDLIRPNGQHVITDYRDFSGDGPNAPTGAAEAFGDASSVAAQGNQVYDLSDYTNAAHPLPKGCNITVKGIAPGASLVAMKVFGEESSAYNSVILQGLDWALSHDHANVLSESFGGYPVPDSTRDLTRAFNEQAVAAGATVVESTGDSGVESSVSSASSDPAVIAAGASTTLRAYSQTTSYGFNFASGRGWLSDNISSIESAGYAQGGRVLDLVAPGEANWALCSPNIAVYEECTSFAGKGSGLQQFGGTSESAPFIAGGAALVIQAYKDTHGGKAPSPALVRQLLTSTSRDLGFPSAEEGAGELNSLAAVQAARSVPTSDGTPAPTGKGLLFNQGQLAVNGPAGSSQTKTLKVTNTGDTTQIVHATVRGIAKQLSDQKGQTSLTASSPTFVDQFGAARPYSKVQFTVPQGADRLVAYDAYPGPNARVQVSLIDPHGNYAATNRPQGNGNHGEVDVHAPAAGQWTAIVFLRDGTFTGPVNYEFVTQQYGKVATASPSQLTIRPGRSGNLEVPVDLPANAGDSSEDLVVAGSGGQTTNVPIVRRSLVRLTSGTGTFTHPLIGGNGRNGAGQPGQLDTYEFDVPQGAPSLAAAISFSGSDGTEIDGTLIDPHGEALGTESTHRLNADGSESYGHSLQIVRADPEAGRWRLVVDAVNPIGGNSLAVPYNGAVTIKSPTYSVKGLPNDASTTLAKGKPVTATVSIKDTGPAPAELFLDPRLTTREDFPVLSLTPDSGLTLPLPPTQLPGVYLIPSQTNRLTGAVQATKPVTLELAGYYGDPDVVGPTSGTSTSVTLTDPEIAPSLFFLAPALIGPFSGPVAKAKASTGLLAHTRDFDGDVETSTGDLYQQTVDPNAADYTPVTVQPGKTGTLKATITPSGRSGRTVRGTLFLDSFSEWLTNGNEVLAIPYEYTVR
jgi:hypothetical protein